jgi:hypothetical protein
MQPAPWQPESLPVHEQQALVKRLDDLGVTLNPAHNRLALVAEVVQPSLQTVIDTLKQQIDAIHRQIRSHIEQHPDLKRRVTLLDSIPSIGPATRAQTLALGERLIRFEHVSRVLPSSASILNLLPQAHQSMLKHVFLKPARRLCVELFIGPRWRLCRTIPSSRLLRDDSNRPEKKKSDCLCSHASMGSYHLRRT